MKSHANENRLLWLFCGVVGGLCLAYLWPHEELQASATDHSENFAICTVEVAPLAAPEAVFVLNFTTGEIRGALLNQQAGAFTNFWIGNVLQDFQIQSTGKSKFAIIPGQAFLAANGNAGGAAIASGVLYVGELSSGKVCCYAFQYSTAPGIQEPRRLDPVAQFPFKNPSQK